MYVKFKKRQQRRTQTVRLFKSRKPSMKKILITLATAILSAVLAQTFSLEESHSNQRIEYKKSQYTGRVKAVSDGDTLRLIDKNGRTHKIRLAYIDAPETTQAYGQIAKTHLQNLVLNETITVKVIDVDQYQREVAQISKNNIDINLKLLEEGHAWHYRSIAAKTQNKAEFYQYEAAEKQARSQRQGLWKQRHPQAPWAYRKEQRNH